MNRVVVVEGYMDVVMLAEHGVRNAVATLGTATTPTHVQKLLKQADEVVFCFDGDAAGRRAAWHALEVSLECLADRKTVRFLFLPAEHDPDSFVREFGREAFEERIAGAETLSAFLLRALTEKCDLRTLEGRSKLVAEAKPLVKRIAAPALRVQLVRALAGPAQMEPGEVARLLEVRDGLVARAAPARPGPAREDRAASRRSTEGKLLRAILGEPELAQLLPIELVGTDSPDGAALAAVADWVVHHADAVPRPLSSAFEDEAFYPLLAALEADLLDQRLGEEALRADFDGLVRRLRERAIEREIKALEAKAGGAGLAEHERAAYGRLIREQAALRQPPGAPPDLVAAARTPI
jgi:DNA primase